MGIITASHARRGKRGVPERLCGRTCGPLLVAAKKVSLRTRNAEAGKRSSTNCGRAIPSTCRMVFPRQGRQRLCRRWPPQHPVAAASRLRTALSGKPIKPLGAFDAMARPGHDQAPSANVRSMGRNNPLASLVPKDLHDRSNRRFGRKPVGTIRQVRHKADTWRHVELVRLLSLEFDLRLHHPVRGGDGVCRSVYYRRGNRQIAALA